MNEFRISESPEATAQQAAEYLVGAINAIVADRGECHVVLPGGSTPARCLEIMSSAVLPWDSIHWYPGDERCLPTGDPDRNDTLIIDRLFAGRSPGINLHSIPAELGADDGASTYADELSDIERFDIVVLGMGEDGHTASLFPGHSSLEERTATIAEHDAPKPPMERVSIGMSLLQSADQRIVITTGAGKKAALARVLDGEPLPIALLDPHIWFLDEAAVPENYVRT